RWISRDPLREQGFNVSATLLLVAWTDAGLSPGVSSWKTAVQDHRTPNLYCVVGNSPLGIVDPWGLFVIDWRDWSWGDFWGWGLTGACGGAICGITGGPRGIAYGVAGGFVAGAGGVALSYCFKNIHEDPPRPDDHERFEHNYRRLPAKFQ